ncbi:uncharacterized protein LOC142774534 [Rhipicephalus microplus]|uniref:uncharacterized protein LOC142774534 n=1 Tax=Rhipicephalus microplus TaxID=6941 RepID=UPI003F6CF32D
MLLYALSWHENSHCFVPRFTTGYKSVKKKHALFGVPKDEALLAHRRRAIPLADKLLQENSAECELHFGERLHQQCSSLFDHMKERRGAEKRAGHSHIWKHALSV